MIPFFSIVIPAYNAEAFLPETLESLSKQTFDQYEIIIVDDGSTDGTFEIIRCAAEVNPKIRIVHQDNKGPLLARRTALTIARGKYAIFLDSDDLLRDDALEIIYKAALKNNPDIISYPYSRVSNFSEPEHAQLKPGFYVGQNYQKVQECICRGRFCNLWDKAVKLQCIDLNSDYSNYKGLMHGEDFFQLIPIIDRSSSLIELSEPLYFYRVREGSSTSRFRMKQLEDIATVCQRLILYATQWGKLCTSLAAIGEAKQYLNLLKIAESGSESETIKSEFISTIRNTMIFEGVFTRASKARLRLDDRLIVSLLSNNKISSVQMIIRSIEKIKTILRHKL